MAAKRRRWRWLGLAALILLVGTVIALASYQSNWIYYPRRYEPTILTHLPAGIAALHYRTGQGDQVSFYQAPASGRAPQRLWLFCDGQGNVALEWSYAPAQINDPEAGYLFFDYPGFGLCAGSCTPGRILEASEAAVEALRRHLGLTPEQFAPRLGVFGYSLGTAAVMQYAARHPVRRIVLGAPFTSLVEMGHRMFFWPCGEFLWHRFDNQARLAEVALQNSRPPVLIVHGDRDDTIPVEMPTRLAAPYPGWVERLLVPGGDHNSVATDALRRLAAP